MTLLIAAKAGPGLKPNGSHLVFEQGIVIAADTRLTYADGTSVDDGLKVESTGPHGICGMASDSIDIPTQAFYRFDGFMSEYPNISSNEAVAELQRLLHEAHVTVSSKLGQPNLKTSVFFGHQNPSTNRFVLSRLDSEDNFAPKTRDGLNAAGSHADWVIESFEHIKAEYPTLTHRPFDGFPNGKVPLREGVVPLVLDLIHAALEVAKAEEVKRGSQQLIGGAVQAAIITSEGPKVANPEWNYKLKAWQIFDNRLA